MGDRIERKINQWPNAIDTLTGLPPGDLIGGQYTFQNGNPPIPMALDYVAADGTKSFVKPNAAYDNIEYMDFTSRYSSTRHL
jgi:hypothetical protein